MLDLYKNIKKERMTKGWSQTELAKRVGYSDKSMIAKIEAGKVDLPQTKIRAFANVFGVTESALMGWQEQINDFKDEAEKNGYAFEVLHISENEVQSIDSHIITNQEEYELLKLFRMADKETQRMIVEMLTFFKSKKQD